LELRKQERSTTTLAVHTALLRRHTFIMDTGMPHHVMWFTTFLTAFWCGVGCRGTTTFTAFGLRDIGHSLIAFTEISA
tara:strand:- start:756 stop:989 length:234 start_codon:yes stop_codon:yes gene_type:complete